MGQLGPGARPVLPRRQGSEVCGSRVDERFVPGQPRRQARIASGGEDGKGPLVVPRLGSMAPAPGGHRRRVSAARESAQFAEGASIDSAVRFGSRGRPLGRPMNSPITTIVEARPEGRALRSVELSSRAGRPSALPYVPSN